MKSLVGLMRVTAVFAAMILFLLMPTMPAYAHGRKTTTLPQQVSSVTDDYPEISNVVVFALSGSSVWITWDTNIPADSCIEYGLTPEYGLVVSDATTGTFHSLVLNGLFPVHELYYFQISSWDGIGSPVDPGNLHNMHFASYCRIFHNDASNAEIAVWGTIYDRYMAQGGPSGVLGAPEFTEDAVVSGATGIAGRIQMFEDGAIVLHKAGDYNGQAFVSWGTIDDRYYAWGSAPGVLGFSIAEEEAVMSGATGIAGQIQVFENGLITLHEEGMWEDQGFVTTQAVYTKYMQTGGGTGALGFSIDNVQSEDNTSWAAFEHGKIVCSGSDSDSCVVYETITQSDVFTGEWYSFGDTDARIYFTAMGTVDTVTVTLAHTYPTAPDPLGHLPLPRWYEITGNGDGFAATVVLGYEDAELVAANIPLEEESNLHLYQYTGNGAWLEHSEIDPLTNQITTTLTAFGVYAIATPEHQPTRVAVRRIGILNDGIYPYFAGLAGIVVFCKCILNAFLVRKKAASSPTAVQRRVGSGRGVVAAGDRGGAGEVRDIMKTR